MHATYIFSFSMSVHTRLGIHISTFTNIFTSVCRLPCFKLVTWKIWHCNARQELLNCQVAFHDCVYSCFSLSVSESTIYWISKESIVQYRMLLLAKYNSSCEGVSGVVNRHASDVCQDLSSCEICLCMAPNCLGSTNIVTTVVNNLRN